MQAVQFVITMTADGRVEVNGPIENKALFYGMVELAKDAVRAYQPGGIELVADADIHWYHVVGRAGFLEQDVDFVAVRRRPGIEIDHEVP